MSVPVDTTYCSTSGRVEAANVVNYSIWKGLGQVLHLAQALAALCRLNFFRFWN